VAHKEKIMSDQETTVVEETTEEQIGTQPEATSPETSSGVSQAAESSSSAEEATSQPEDQVVPSNTDGAQAGESAADEDELTIYALKPREQLVGKVKNITSFGAFVDIGLPQDGLVHISELSRRKVDKVTDVVGVGDEIDVWVKKVDKKRGRISLTMVKPVLRRLRDIKEGDELEGRVTRLESYGAFVDIDSDREGLVHISQITHDYINNPEEALNIGDKVDVKVLKVNRKKRQVDLSIKALLPPPQPPEPEVKEVPVVEEQASESEVDEAESAPTAMALAYAAFQDANQSEEESSKEKEESKKGKHREEMDAILSRTLASRD
jgi:transcriptional accessory protein Tex/SPT6